MSETIDTRILSAIRKPGGISGGDLAHQLGISRAAVWSHMEELRALGYEIEAGPHRGYRLISAPDLLHADDLMAQLTGPLVVGREIAVFQETTSTSDIVDKLARDGVKEGMVVFAESQTRGRGRLGRRWHSPPGKGLWFTVLLRPDMRPSAATRFVIAAAVALCRALRETAGVQPEIKWPNDVLIRGRKVAGILIEMNAELDHINYLLLGIGVGVNLEARDYPAELKPLATSLRIETRALVNRASLAVAILRELDQVYLAIRGGHFTALTEEWYRQCGTLGGQVTIKVGDRIIQGRVEAIDDEGVLLLRTQHGRIERILGGDVTVIK
jgi:BirA family transcriptional regulator, biotin operon repressor / biotin---[acetyl-CoA-carboxylase] ligase